METLQADGLLRGCCAERQEGWANCRQVCTIIRARGDRRWDHAHTHCHTQRQDKTKRGRQTGEHWEHREKHGVWGDTAIAMTWMADIISTLINVFFISHLIFPDCWSQLSPHFTCQTCNLQSAIFIQQALASRSGWEAPLLIKLCCCPPRRK